MRGRLLTVSSIWLLCAFIFIPASAQESIRVDPGHAIYDHLDHFRARGRWWGSLEERPMSRADLLAAIDSVARHADALSGPDRHRLDRMLAIGAEWREAARSPERRTAAVRRIPPVLWEAGGTVQFFGGPSDLDSLVTVSRRPRDQHLFAGNLRNEIAGRLGMDVRIYVDYSRFGFRPDGHDWIDNLPEAADHVTIDASIRMDRAVVSYAGDWAEVRFGRESRRWGTGRRGGLFLSENPYPLDGLSLHLRTRYVSGVSLFAQTQRGPNPPSYIPGEPYPPDSMFVDVPGDAFVAMHRIEFGLPGRLNVGLYEAAAYGGRGIDFAYINPIGLLLAMTQDVYDQSNTDDKKVVGADVRIDLPPVTVYGEFLLDRLVVLDAAEEAEVPGISSFAELVGARWANPFGIAGADLDIEYAHLDPQVYFHHDMDIRRSFVRDDALGNEGRLLGHWLGPNADDVYVGLHLPLGAGGGRLGLEFERARWGIVDGQRGDEIGFYRLKKTEKRWITGDVASERMLRVSWEREGLPAPLLGRVDTQLSMARIERSGAWRDADGTSLERDGWQLEGRLVWRFGARYSEG